MSDITDSEPVWIPSQFAKAIVYHLLFGILGPFSALIIRCFETTIYIQNCGFIPSESPLKKGVGVFVYA